MMVAPGARAKIAVVVGASLLLSGVALVVLYVWEAVVTPWGDPDQSLLFWYSPLLMLGVGGASLGLVLMAWGRGRGGGS